jgi:flavin-dependent dehydrogenase
MLPKPITIIGGGLAGLTLGIGLRRRATPVTIWESGHYPRHRVCGEFISGQGVEVLKQLSLLRAFEDAGAISANTVTFFSSQERSPVRALSEPAICLSRFAMDALLARKFQEYGGDLRIGERRSQNGEGVVRASGRRSQATENGWRWLGLKVHARNVPLEADLEMHVVPNGYVGLCRLNEGINICGLFRRRARASSFSSDWKALLCGPHDSALNRRLAHADFDENSFCSVAGLVLNPQRACEEAECRIGDALTMIPPLTGNGMSMAFESAGIAIDPLAAYSQGKLSWREVQQTISQNCDRHFARRLSWAKWLHRLTFSPTFQNLLGSPVLRSNLVWRTMFTLTR